MKLDVQWQPQHLEELSALPLEQRNAIEQTVEELRIAPYQGHTVKNMFDNFREIVAGGYRIFYLIVADTIQVTGLQRV